MKIACYKEKLIKPATRVVILEFNATILIRISILNSGKIFGAVVFKSKARKRWKKFIILEL